MELFYREKGSGEPLILLHGNGENGECFHYQLDDFSSRYRVIAVDTRGHGSSPRGDKPFTLEQFSNDLSAFLDELGLEKVNLLGFSDGGNIALLFALAHPERVKRLVLSGANLFPSGVKASVMVPLHIIYAVNRPFCRVSQKARHTCELFSLMLHEPKIDPESLRKLPMRTLVIAGTNDMIKSEHTKCIYEHLSDARIAILKGDHFLAYKCSEEFDRVVLAFLEEQ